MHHPQKHFNKHSMLLVLEELLVVFTVHEEMLEQLLKQLHGHHGVIQIRTLAQRLLKVSKQGLRDLTLIICGVGLLAGKLVHALQLDDEAGEVQAVD